MEWPQIVTALVAAYAAILSTFTQVRSRKEYKAKQKEKERQISITITWGTPTYDREIGELSPMITITNPGFRDVIIDCPYLKLPDGRSLVFTSPDCYFCWSSTGDKVSFPYRLPEGNNCNVLVDPKETYATLRESKYSAPLRIKAEVRDATDKVYKSERYIEIDLDKCLSP